MNQKADIAAAIEVLQNDGIILYPTDTIWGIGADACNDKAVQKIFDLKQRNESRSMIILLADEKQLSEYTAGNHALILEFLSNTEKPTTVIYPKAKNLAAALIHQDGSIGIRITKDAFCMALIEALGRPIVSTSANISGAAAAAQFEDISAEIKNGVDYIVQHRSNKISNNAPSSIVRLEENGSIHFLRR